MFTTMHDINLYYIRYATCPASYQVWSYLPTACPPGQSAVNTTGGLACLGKCMHLVSDVKVCLLEFACGSSSVVDPAELEL